MVDRAKIVSLVERKHRFRLDQDDPSLAVATISEAVFTEMQAEIQKMLAAHLEQFSAAAQATNGAATARGEQIITEAAKFAQQQIKTAGEAVAEQVEGIVQRGEAAARSAAFSAWISGGAAIVALLIAVMQYFH
jgi:cobalamin biosynthesis Mg chelatase CobN